ncbi:MAG TPA: MBG domain-containing protein, partial [Roseiflexaceae bacterium]|nr:MBG domain-containing protein [Roseiflexaceae bacterium]
MLPQARSSPFFRNVRTLIVATVLLCLCLNAFGSPAVTRAAGPTITSPVPPAGTYGTLYLHTFTADSVAVFTVSSGTLPLGLALAPTGLLTGTPLQSGSFPLTVTATGLLGAGTQSFTLTVSKRALTLTADNLTKTYGDAVPSLTYTASGLLNGDTLAAILSGAPATTATQTSPVGNYPITQGTLSALNYVISFVNGTLAVTKAPLRVSADDLTRKVGVANPPLTMNYSGFVLGETASALSALPSASTLANTASPAGEYPITLTGGSALNYVLELVNGILTITDKNVPIITWSDPTAITYGTPLSASQLNGIANFGGLSVPGLFSYDPPLGTVLDAGNDQPLHLTFTPVDGALFAPVELTVHIDVLRAPLTVTVDNKQRPYGSNNPALTFTVDGLVNNDTAQSALSGALSTVATTTSPVGTYPILQGTLGAVNYIIDVVEGVLTIDKAPLVATANNLIR